MGPLKNAFHFLKAKGSLRAVCLPHQAPGASLTWARLLDTPLEMIQSLWREQDI